MIDVNRYTKVGEFRNNSLHWLEGRDINAVYLIMIGKDSYIGSSKYIYTRIQEHISQFKRNEHTDKMTTAYNAKKEFDVYTIERGIDENELESKEYKYIKTLKPTLNTIGKSSHGGLNIKRAIKSRGLEIKEVASRMGITNIGLSQHINGNPSVEVLERIAKAIGCDVRDLFDVPEAEDTNVVCPKCGYEMKIKVE